MISIMPGCLWPPSKHLYKFSHKHNQLHSVQSISIFLSACFPNVLTNTLMVVAYPCAEELADVSCCVSANVVRNLQQLAAHASAFLFCAFPFMYQMFVSFSLDISCF